jgi:hypothetical protein
MDPNLFLAFLVLRGDLTQSQRRRIQIKLGAMAQQLDPAILQTAALDVGALLRLHEEYKPWRAALGAEEVDQILHGGSPAAAAAGRGPASSFQRGLFAACLEDAIAKRMDAVVLRFDEMSRPALEILYRYGPHVRDAMALQDQLAHEMVSEVHEMAGTGPLAEARTTVFQFEIEGIRHSFTLHQSPRRNGKETLEIRLSP